MDVRDWFRKIILIGLSALLIGCGTRTPTPAANPSSKVCANQLQVVTAFFDANDAEDYGTSLSYLTDDVILVFWAEGINGHHMGQNMASGPDQIRPFLERDGLRLNSGRSDLPNFKLEDVQQIGNQLFFELTPDSTHADGRPYDPYVVEMIFKGCKIDIIKLVERITWV